MSPSMLEILNYDDLTLWSFDLENLNIRELLKRGKQQKNKNKNKKQKTKNKKQTTKNKKQNE